MQHFRPNIVIETASSDVGFVENSWGGCLLQIGGEAILELLVPTPRCSVPTLAHGELPPDPEVLGIIMGHNRVQIPGVGAFPCAGLYAQVRRPGRIRRGDLVRFMPVT